MSPLPGPRLLLLLLAAGAVPSGERIPRAIPAPRLPQRTTLTVLEKAPLPALGREVRFDLQWKGWREDRTFFGGRFDPYEWRAFEAWGDEARLWDEEAFDAPAGRLQVRRGSDAERLLAAAEPYARFRVTGVVREVFLGEPWIEVLAAEPLPGRVPEGSLLHVERAIGCMERGQWDLAVDQLERARSAPVPAHVGREIERMITECRFVAREE